MTEDAFPLLSSFPPMESQNVSSTWRSAPGWHGRTRAKSIDEGSRNALSTSPESAAPVMKGKKWKAKKVLLFSTGGHRGGA